VDFAVYLIGQALKLLTGGLSDAEHAAELRDIAKRAADEETKIDAAVKEVESLRDQLAREVGK
jgi:hypothetical protein